jgi:pyruvate kinase
MCLQGNADEARKAARAAASAPTHTEDAFDGAAAVFDGADAAMPSAETAAYPWQALN